MISVSSVCVAAGVVRNRRFSDIPHRLIKLSRITEERKEILMRFHLVLIMTIAALSAAAAQDEAAKKAPESVVAERRDFTEEATRRGTFVPTVFDEIEIWPEEYAGEWLFLEVLPHGTPVGDNDVIARFCPR